MSRNNQPQPVPEGAAGTERSEVEAAPSGRRGAPGGRSVEDKVSAIRELLSGKATVDQLALRFGVKSETIEGWRQEAMAAIDLAFRKGPSPEERALARQYGALQKAFTDLAIRHELATRYIESHPQKPRKS
jgi:transposase-like protein